MLPCVTILENMPSAGLIWLQFACLGLARALPRWGCLKLAVVGWDLLVLAWVVSRWLGLAWSGWSWLGLLVACWILPGLAGCVSFFVCSHVVFHTLFFEVGVIKRQTQGRTIFCFCFPIMAPFCFGIWTICHLLVWSGWCWLGLCGVGLAWLLAEAGWGCLGPAGSGKDWMGLLGACC